MGYILDTATQRKVPLRAHHPLGRGAEKVDTVISHPAVSRIHAVLEWFHDGWQVRDLSRNGTWLDGAPLGGEPAFIANHAVLRIGDVLAVIE